MKTARSDDLSNQVREIMSANADYFNEFFKDWDYDKTMEKFEKETLPKFEKDLEKYFSNLDNKRDNKTLKDIKEIYKDGKSDDYKKS